MTERIAHIGGKRRRHDSGAQKKWGCAELVTAGCVLLIRLWFYLCVNMPQIEVDTHTYVELTWEQFLLGKRMPLYSLLIQANRFLFRDNYLMGVVGCQIVVSLIAIVYLYRAVRMATENRGIACIIVFFYGGNPWIMHCDVQILTESLALSISIFLLYHTVCYIRSHSFRSGIMMVFCVLLSVLLKTAMLVYVISFLIFMAIQFFCIKEIRKTVLKLSAALLGIACLLLVYAGLIWKGAGTFSVDNKVPRHMLIACLETGLYKNYPDSELVKEMERIYLESEKSSEWLPTQKPILALFGDNLKEYNIRVSEFNNYCIRSDPGTYVKYLISRFIKCAGKEYKIEEDENNLAFRRIYRIQAILFPTIKIGHAYLVCAAVLLLLIVKWRRNRECPWYYLGTAGMIMVILVSVIVGTYTSYVRCTSYVLPFMFFGLGLLFQDLFMWLKKCRG